MRRRTPAALLAVLALAVATLLGAPAAHADEDLPAGWYSQPHTSALTEVVRFGDSAYWSERDYPAWQRAGFPAPRPAPTDYVRYPWSPNIYAVTFWPERWEWERLAFEQWQRAGFPAARAAGYVEGTRYWKWETGGEIFAEERDGAVHKLTYGEWLASGSREPEYRTGRGYVKLSWYPSIAYLYNTGQGDGYAISYADWAEEDFPTPQVVQRVAGDRFYRYSFDSTVYYQGPNGSFAVTPAQYRAAGSPRVDVL